MVPYHYYVMSFNRLLNLEHVSTLNVCNFRKKVLLNNKYIFSNYLLFLSILPVICDLIWNIVNKGDLTI